MKIKEGFVLREIAGQYVAVPVGRDINLDMMITLNETGHMLWQRLEQEAEFGDLVDALMKEYGIDRNTATEHVTAFINKLKENNFVE